MLSRNLQAGKNPLSHDVPGKCCREMGETGFIYGVLGRAFSTQRVPEPGVPCQLGAELSSSFKWLHEGKSYQEKYCVLPTFFPTLLKLCSGMMVNNSLSTHPHPSVIIVTSLGQSLYLYFLVINTGKGVFIHTILP